MLKGTKGSQIVGNIIVIPGIVGNKRPNTHQLKQYSPFPIELFICSHLCNVCMCNPYMTKAPSNNERQSLSQAHQTHTNTHTTDDTVQLSAHTP